MTLEATVEGRTVRVEVTLRDGRHAVELDGRPVEVDLVRIGPHFWSLLVDGRSHELALERGPDGFRVHLPTAILRVEIAAASRGTGRAAAHRASGPARVSSPMPGRVVRVFVRPGTEVRAGERLMVIEAMKMENELRATQPGLVTEVAVREGEAVEGGALLVVIA